MPVKRHRAANGGCQTTNQSGTPCAAPPTRDSHYCSLHHDNNKEMMSATVTLTDDRECRIVVGLEIIEEWQFRKRALEFLFFGEVGESS